MKKKLLKEMLGDVIAQGPLTSRRPKNVEGYIIWIWRNSDLTAEEIFVWWCLLQETHLQPKTYASPSHA